MKCLTVPMAADDTNRGQSFGTGCLLDVTGSLVCQEAARGPGAWTVGRDWEKAGGLGGGTGLGEGRG